MKSTKKLTVSATVVALGVVFMLIGAVFEPLDLAAACIASVLVAFVFAEIGGAYPYLVWLCTSLISAIVYFAGIMWVAYLFVFGIYPIIKAYIERTAHALWLPLKLCFAALSFSVLYVVTVFVLGVPLISEELFGMPPWVIYLLTALVALAAFVMYDFYLTAAIRLYYYKLRKKIQNILK